jgi:hypothetical protein
MRKLIGIVRVVARVGAGLSAAVAGVGCCGLQTSPQHRACVAEDVASTHLAVLSVKRWTEYRDELQPAFSLTADEALNRVLPESGRTQDSAVSSVFAELEYGRSKHGKTAATEASADNAGPADAPKVPSAGSLLESKTDAASWLLAPLQKDPMLQYLAATALYQEVKLLNTYIRDAAISANHEAYIVRLQLSVFPKRRYEPYDIYATIGLMKEAKPGAEVTMAQHEVGANTKVLSRDVASPGSDDGSVQILPLLVTDNLEGAIRQSSRERIIDIAAAVAVASPAIAAGGSVSVSLDELRRTLARDYNSVYTVARAGEGAMRVRMGAPSVGLEEYAMTARTQNITMLVLAPRSTGIRAVCKTTFVDAKSGVTLREAGEERAVREARAALAPLVQNACECGRLTDDALAGMLAAASGTDPGQGLGAFESAWKCFDPEGKALARAWLALLDVAGKGMFTTAGVPLPDAKLPEFKLTGIVPLIIDDGTTAQIELPGGQNLDRAVLAGTMKITPQAGSPTTIPVRSVTAPAEGRGGTLRVVMPSLKRLGIIDPRAEAKTALALSVSYIDAKSGFVPFITDLACRYACSDLVVPATFRIVSSRARLSAGTTGKDACTLTIIPDFPFDATGAIVWPSGELAVECVNADIEGVTESTAKVVGGRLLLGVPNRPARIEPFQVTVQLKGLRKDQKVVLTPTYAGKKTSEPIEIGVD